MIMPKITSTLSLVLMVVAAGAAVAAVPQHRELPAVDAAGLPALAFPLPDRAGLAAEDKRPTPANPTASPCRRPWC
jgi:hypothetical protein